MNVNVASLASLSGASAIAPQAGNVSASDPAVSEIGPATVTRISPQGNMLSKLRDLQASDPEAFQAKMKEMADHLRADAKERGGEEGKMLNAMADEVTKAAKTGDLSGLKPPSGGHGRGGPPPPGGVGGAGGAGGGQESKAASSSSGSSSGSSDPADTNGDGTVSAVEQAAYDLTHPKAATA